MVSRLGLENPLIKIHISGWIFEGTNQYNVSFFVSGGFLLLAGMISCVVDLLKRKRDR